MSFATCTRMGLNLRQAPAPGALFKQGPLRTVVRGYARPAQQQQSLAVALPLRAQGNGARGARNAILIGTGIAAIGGLSAWDRAAVACEPAPPAATVPAKNRPSSTVADEDSPKSIVNVYQLSFGSVCGICAGVFIKKGLKFIAFILGGGFVLLQYLSSQRLIQVNWGALSSRYDNLLSRVAGPSDPASTSGKANTNTNTAQRLWIRTTHFLTADFQPRATFMAGLLLGLRLG